MKGKVKDMNPKHGLWQLTVFPVLVVIGILFGTEVLGIASEVESIAISGPALIATASSANYMCTATWTDGSTSTVRPTMWSVSSTNYASVSETGNVTNKNMTTSDKTVTLKAVYALDGTIKEASKTITLAANTLVSVTITGDRIIPFGGTATYKCTATWSYGPSSTLLSPNWMLTSTTYASISASGVVTNKNTETTEKSVRLNVNYTVNGVTQADTVSIVLQGAPVIPKQTLTLQPGWNWVGFHVLPQSRTVGDTLGNAGFAANSVIQTNGDSARFNGASWLMENYPLDFGKLYQIYVANTVAVEVSGEASLQTSVPLASGWNWVGNPTAEAVPISQMVHNNGWTANDRIQTSGGSSVTYANGKWVPAGFSLQPGNGCQIYTGKAGMLAFLPFVPDDELYAVVDLSGGPNAPSYPVRYSSTGPDLSDDACRTTELWLRKIPAGTFFMGSHAGEVGRMIYSDEEGYQVTLTEDYYVGVFECTQYQWEMVMGEKPSYFSNEAYYATRPVEKVSFDMVRGSSASAGDGWPAYGHAVDADSFMGILREKTGLLFDLPTEAQWEYACRAGTTTSISTGKNLLSDSDDTGDAAVDEVGRYQFNGGGSIDDTSEDCTTANGTAKVGSYLPNAWGLYDMHGNLAEWCLDRHANRYDTTQDTDPVGPATGGMHMIRGGAWNGVAGGCRSASRNQHYSSVCSNTIGFRVACHPRQNMYVVVDLSGGPNASSYPVRYTDMAPDLSDDTCRTTELWLRKIPAGTFTMGSPADELGRYARNEMAQHDVTLTQDYYIGVFECTQKQWELVIGGNPSQYAGDTRPVAEITYQAVRGDSTTGSVRWPEYGHAVDAASFMGKLQEKTGLTFDLPTEAQWEYACRAGTTTALNSGCNLMVATGSDPNMNDVGRYDSNIGDGAGGYGPPTKVGSYLPNAWGLYDMHGNVEEWCLDRDGADVSSTAAETDPAGPDSGSLYRVLRGGSWNNSARACRSASRNYLLTSGYGLDVGFRVACHRKEPEPKLYAVVDLSGGTTALSYPVRYTNTPPDVNDDTCRTTELWLRRIPKGTFMMGSPEDELGHYSNEDLHEVTLEHDFFIGVFECTQKQWELITGGKPSEYEGDCRPVSNVSYDIIRGTSATGGAGWPQYGFVVDMNSFMSILRNKTGLLFDLPMETQWEYACRAGTTTALNSGKNLTTLNEEDANLNEVGRYRLNKQYGEGGYSEYTKVGSYLPNAWGLYDMHGNVSEWCLDGGVNTIGEFDRSMRGGNWLEIPRCCRSAHKNKIVSRSCSIYLGFRITIQTMR